MTTKVSYIAINHPQSHTSSAGNFVFMRIMCFTAPVTLVFEQSTYSVTETDGSQTITVCVVAPNGVLSDGVEAIVVTFQFTGEAMGKK